MPPSASSIPPRPTLPALPGGFDFLEEVFSADELAAARQGQEQLMAGRCDRVPDFAWPAPRARQARSWKTPYSTFFRSELAALARSPRLLSLISERTGARSIRFWFDQLLWEGPAHPSREPDPQWHTERSRWKTCQAPLMLTVWVPLDAILPEMGPITMVRGSARREWLELPDGWSPAPPDILPSPVQPGDAALFCWHTVHGNPPNLADRPRRAIALHYAIDSLRYRPHGKFSHPNERVVALAETGPDFHDERVCPLLWRRQSPQVAK